MDRHLNSKEQKKRPLSPRPGGPGTNIKNCALPPSPSPAPPGAVLGSRIDALLASLILNPVPAQPVYTEYTAGLRLRIIEARNLKPVFVFAHYKFEMLTPSSKLALYPVS